MKLIKKLNKKFPQKSQIIAMTLRCAMMEKFGLEILLGVIKKQFQLCFEMRRDDGCGGCKKLAEVRVLESL